MKCPPGYPKPGLTVDEGAHVSSADLMAVQAADRSQVVANGTAHGHSSGHGHSSSGGHVAGHGSPSPAAQPSAQSSAQSSDGAFADGRIPIPENHATLTAAEEKEYLAQHERCIKLAKDMSAIAKKHGSSWIGNALTGGKLKEAANAMIADLGSGGCFAGHQGEWKCHTCEKDFSKSPPASAAEYRVPDHATYCHQTKPNSCPEICKTTPANSADKLTVAKCLESCKFCWHHDSNEKRGFDCVNCNLGDTKTATGQLAPKQHSRSFGKGTDELDKQFERDENLVSTQVFEKIIATKKQAGLSVFSDIK